MDARNFVIRPTEAADRAQLWQLVREFATSGRAGARGVRARGAIGAGAHAAVGKALGRERATRGGVGYAASQHRSGATVAALVVANAVGDVIGSDGEVIAGPETATGGCWAAPS
jgi:L-aminopeptidase/D-esterase-like protein